MTGSKCFDINKNSLISLQPLVDSEILHNPDDTYPFFYETVKDNISIIRLKPDGTKKYLTSRKNPRREANRFVESLDISENGKYILFGCGTGMVLESILERLAKNGKLIVCEPHVQLFKIFISISDRGNLFTDSRLVFIIQKDYQSFIDSLKSKLDNDEDSTEYKFIPYPVMLEGLPDDWREFAVSIEGYLLQKQSQTYFSSLLHQNIQQNIVNIDRAQNSGWLYKLFNKRPVIVVGAGASLDKILMDRHVINKNAFILSTGTAMMTLINCGIVPDGVILTDPQIVVIKQIVPYYRYKIPLFALPGVHPEIFNEYSGKYSFCLVKNDPLPDEWEEAKKRFINIETGGSVVTAAISLAVLMNSTSIALLGCDFSYPFKKTHATNTFHFRSLLNAINKFSNHEMLNINPEDNDIVYVDGVEGDRLLSRKNLRLYHQWTEKFIKQHPDVKFYQISEYGALIKGADIVSLKDWNQIINKTFL